MEDHRLWQAVRVMQEERGRMCRKGSGSGSRAAQLGSPLAPLRRTVVHDLQGARVLQTSNQNVARVDVQVQVPTAVDMSEALQQAYQQRHNLLPAYPWPAGCNSCHIGPQ